MESKIVEIANIKVFRKCCPGNCQYCKFKVDCCTMSTKHCPKCGTYLGQGSLNPMLNESSTDDILSVDENIRT